MKDESVLNVLMYLFKNHMQENCTLDLGEKKTSGPIRRTRIPPHCHRPSPELAQ